MKLTDILGGLWAITPDMLDEIQNIYATHLRGPKVDIAGIEARLGRSLTNERRYMEVKDGVAVLSANGVMAKRANLFMDISGGVSTQILADEFKEALADPEVKSILMDLDSPGGAVDGTLELASLIRESRGQKPIIAFTDGMMTSGAYWVGSAADKVYISGDTTAVGSIGVIARHLDYSKYLDMQGVKSTEIKAGKYKGIGSEYKPLSDDDKAVIQADIDYVYSTFVNSVAEHRGLSVDNLDEWAEARVFRGKQAIEAGLVDGVATRDSLLEQLSGGDPGGSLTHADNGGCGGGT